MPKRKAPAPKASNWKDWLATQYEVLELPSGLIARVHRVSIKDLALSGQIPAPLLGEVARSGDIRTGGSDLDTIEDYQKNPQIMEIVTLVARAAMIEPKIGVVTDDTHLGLSDFTVGDRLEVFNWAKGEAQAMLPFPDADDAGAGALGRGGEISPDAKPVPEVG